MKRLRAGLTAFNTLITGAIVLGMTLLCLILSEKSARTESFRNFSGQMATAAAYLQSQDRLSLGWLEQLETAGQLHTSILDGGAPLFSVGLNPARDGTAAEAARRIARQDYGLPEKNRLFTCTFSMTDQGKAYFAGVAKIPKEGGALEITMLCPLDSLEQGFARQRLAVGLGTALAVGLLGVFSWSFTGRLLRPIEQSRREQTQFIAAASHELRTPLTAIAGWTDTVESGLDDHTLALQGLDIIKKETRRLSQMVEELLDFSRIESGGMRLQTEPFDLRGELYDAVFTYTDMLRQEGLRIDYEEPEEPLMVFADRNRLKQVFLNIIDNAGKYGKDGDRVQVTAQAAEGSAVVHIRDFGQGIPPDELPFVKQKFYKGSAKGRGTGIGLSVCSDIVQMHGGTLDIESTLGQGTDVIITLPLYRKASGEA